MRKRMTAILLAAMTMAAVVTGCGGADDAQDTETTATEDVTTEDADAEDASASELAAIGEASASEDAEKLSEMAEIVEGMQETVEADLEEEPATEALIQEILEELVMYSGVDPCGDTHFTEIFTYDALYLYTLGKDKAPDHVLTELGEIIYEYVTCIAVDGQSYLSEEAEALLADYDEIMDHTLTDEEAAAELAAEFYELIQ